MHPLQFSGAQRPRPDREDALRAISRPRGRFVGANGAFYVQRSRIKKDTNSTNTDKLALIFRSFGAKDPREEIQPDSRKRKIVGINASNVMTVFREISGSCFSMKRTPRNAERRGKLSTTRAKVPPQRNAAWFAANYPTSTHFSLSFLPAPSSSFTTTTTTVSLVLFAFLSKVHLPFLDLFVGHTSTCFAASTRVVKDTIVLRRRLPRFSRYAYLHEAIREGGKRMLRRLICTNKATMFRESTL